MNTAVGPFEVGGHHCFDLGVAFVGPIGVPGVAWLVGVVAKVPSTVPAPLCACPLIPLSAVLLLLPTAILPTPVVWIIAPARRPLWLPVVSTVPWVARSLCTRTLLACSSGLGFRWLSHSFGKFARSTRIP